MKQVILLLGLGLSLCSHALAAAPTSQKTSINDFRFDIASDKDANPDVFNLWSPDQAQSFQLTTSSFQVVDNSSGPVSGLVDAVCLSSGAAGDFLVLGDTVSYEPTIPNQKIIPGEPLVTAGQQNTIAGLLAVVYTAPFASPVAGTGCQKFDPPLPFSKGLYGNMSSANLRASIRYRLLRVPSVTGVNVNPANSSGTGNTVLGGIQVPQ